jgi:hypothetical protein
MRRISRRISRSQDLPQNNTQQVADSMLPPALEDKMALLKPYIEKNDDLIARNFFLGGAMGLKACVLYFNQVVDDDRLDEHVLKPLMMHGEGWMASYSPAGNQLDLITSTSINVGQLTRSSSFATMVHKVFDGMLVLIIDTIPEAVIIDIRGGPLRSVEEPPSEKAIRGPREGFIENLDMNLSMIRRRLRTPRLVIKKTTVGRRTRTPVAIMYIDDIADQQLIQQIESKINQIDIDGIINAGSIIQFMEEKPYSLFPQIWSSERPDRAVGKLLEGRIAVMVDGTPTAFFLPSLFIEFFQASEDYLERFFLGSYLRFVRFIAFFIAISLPSLYIGLVSFNPELIPLNLAITIAEARKEVPFPVFLETLIQEFIIQMVIEAGLRLPGPVGQTTGVVAGIILGEAAISAKLASPGLIIVIAVTTICTFVLPSGPLIQATRILRLPLIFLTAAFGLFGFSLGLLMIITHLSSLESLGVPYFAPLAPMRYADLKDTLLRVPYWKMKQRPLSIPTQQKQRQANSKQEGGKGESQ